MRWTVFMALGALVLAACGGSSSSPGATGTQRPGASGAATSAPSFALPSIGTIPSFSGTGDTGGSYTLVVEGGSLAGTFPSNAPTGGCFVNAGQLQLALEDEGAGPAGEGLFVSVNADLEKAKSGTSEFLLSVAFGQVESGGTVAGYPSPSGNDGNLKVEDKGSSISIVASGTAFGVAGSGTSQTMRLRLQAECTTIGRF